MGVKVQRPGEPGHPGGNRRIYVRVNHQGYRKTRVFNSSKAAQEYAAQVEAMLKLGQVESIFTALAPEAPPPPVPTFAEAAERYVAVDGAAWKGNTADTYLNNLRLHILPVFGPRPLPEITVADVEMWWAGLRGKGFSHKHLGNIRNVLGGIFQRALASDLIGRNPVDAIKGKLGREDREVRQVEWLTEPELTRFLGVAAEREPRHYPMLLTLLSTGMRLGEALGLQVGDVDLERRKLHIRRSVRKLRVGSPKSGKPRTVDVPSFTVKVLEQWLNLIRAEAAVRGQEPNWLFPSATGGILDDGPVRQAMRRVLRASGIQRHFRLHDLRHSYSSLALQRGVPLLVVSRQLGHASIAITADVYGHLAPDATREAAQAWEAIIAPALPGRNLGATSSPYPA